MVLIIFNLTISDRNITQKEVHLQTSLH